MRRALALAASPGVPTGPDPRVGCVLLDDEGRTVAEGWHRGAGSPHAEADALARAGEAARGTTAVVTLEPCTTPAAPARAPGRWSRPAYARVVVAQGDPRMARERCTLRAPVEVEGGLLEDEARASTAAWTFAMDHGRPFVT